MKSLIFVFLIFISQCSWASAIQMDCRESGVTELSWIVIDTQNHGFMELKAPFKVILYTEGAEAREQFDSLWVKSLRLFVSLQGFATDVMIDATDMSMVNMPSSKRSKVFEKNEDHIQLTIGEEGDYSTLVCAYSHL